MDLEIRAAKTAVTLHGRQLIGLAAPYSTPTQIRSASGEFTEILEPGCFDKAIDDPALDCTCNVNHDDAMILGRTANNTLKIGTDHRGLNFSVELSNDPYAEHIYQEVKRGTYGGCSFAFKLTEGDDTWSERSGKVVRHIRNVSKLFDVSVVARPYYPGTEVDARINQASAETRSMFDKFVQQQAANPMAQIVSAGPAPNDIVRRRRKILFDLPLYD
jgi:HK97 family phage prohead protease